jgi:hypothetical protein
MQYTFTQKYGKDKDQLTDDMFSYGPNFHFSFKTIIGK